MNDENTLNSSDDTYIDFSLGMIDNVPAIQNLRTKEVIKITLNKKRWYY